MELEAGCVVWGIRRLRRYLFGVYFLVFTDRQCLHQICKIGETKLRIQRWIEFLSTYNFRLSDRRGQENANTDFLSRLPLPSIKEDISGASALTDPDDLGVYLIRACGFTIPAFPVPGVGLGGPTPWPCHAPDAVLGGLIPPPDSPVLGGLHLTIDDFRTHRAPMPPTHTTARPRRPYAIPPKAPFTIYAISNPRRCPPAHATHTKPNRDLGWQCPIASGPSHGRPQWVRRVRRFCASSAPHVAASAIGPPRLHGLARSSRLDKLDADPSRPSVGLSATCGALTSYSAEP